MPVRDEDCLDYRPDTITAAMCDLALDGSIDMDDYTAVSPKMARLLRTMDQDEAQQRCADAINAARAQEG